MDTIILGHWASNKYVAKHENLPFPKMSKNLNKCANNDLLYDLDVIELNLPFRILDPKHERHYCKFCNEYLGSDEFILIIPEKKIRVIWTQAYKHYLIYHDLAVPKFLRDFINYCKENYLHNKKNLNKKGKNKVKYDHIRKKHSNYSSNSIYV